MGTYSNETEKLFYFCISPSFLVLTVSYINSFFKPTVHGFQILAFYLHKHNTVLW